MLADDRASSLCVAKQTLQNTQTGGLALHRAVAAAATATAAVAAPYSASPVYLMPDVKDPDWAAELAYNAEGYQFTAASTRALTHSSISLVILMLAIKKGELLDSACTTGRSLPYSRAQAVTGSRRWGG